MFRVTHEIRKMFHAVKTTSVLVKKREKGSEVVARVFTMLKIHEINGESELKIKTNTFIIRRRLNVLG